MGYYSVAFLLGSNLLTAVLVSICHYLVYMSNFPLQSSLKVPRLSPVFQSIQSYNSIKEEHSITSYFNNSLKSKFSDLIDTQSAINIVHTNCSLPQKSEGCSFAQFEALLNLGDRTVCRCDDPQISVGNKCQARNPPEDLTRAPTPSTGGTSIFAVTPTYTRHTQKVDLTSLCYIIQPIENLIWIVVEDSKEKTALVTNLLQRCKVRSVHLNVKTSTVYKVLRSRGVEQRNTALAWIRQHCKDKDSSPECRNGVLYFMDDDNKYDRRLFDEIKKTEVVSVLPVAFSGGLKFEGPICDTNGKAATWRAHYAPDRTFPMDMAGFAVNIASFLAKPGVKMGFKEEKNRRRPVKDGHLETDFLENFADRQSVECRGSDKEALVWHVKTLKPPLPYESKHSSTSKLEV